MTQTDLRSGLQRLLRAGLGCLLALGLSFSFAPHAQAIAPTTGVASQGTITQRAVVRGGGAELRALPGGEILTELPLATALVATGRTADNTWLQVDAGEYGIGWVATDQVVIFGVSHLPVIDVKIIAMPADAKPASAAETELTSEQPAPSAMPAANTATVTAATNSLTATVNTGARNLNVRAGPATSFGIVSALANGTTVSALARNTDGSWVQIQLPQNPDQIGWVSANYVNLNGDANDLPVSVRLSQGRTVAVASAASTRPAGSTLASARPAGLSGTLIIQQSSGGDIYRYDLASGNLVRLTSGLDPALSPDGETVVFARDGGADRGIYLIDSNGGNERRIFAGGAGYRAPGWSPDGQRIVYSRVIGSDACREVYPGICLPDNPFLEGYPLKQRDVWGLSSIDTNGGDFGDIRASNDATVSAWSEQGIVYQSRAGIERADPSNASEPWLILDNGRYQDPDWGRDGGRIVFHSLEKDHRELFTANPDGSGLTALTRPPSALITEPVHNVAAVWSPDGQQIVFLSNRSGPWALWVMNADGSYPRKLPIDIPIEYNFQGEQVVSWGQ